LGERPPRGRCRGRRGSRWSTSHPRTALARSTEAVRARSRWIGWDLGTLRAGAARARPGRLRAIRRGSTRGWCRAREGVHARER
jgi:hypothetical protein